MSRGIMIGGRFVSTTRPYLFAGMSLVMVIVGGVNLGIGTNLDCHDSYCSNERLIYIIAGSCFIFAAACFLVAAISMHIMIKKAIRMHESVVVQQHAQAPPTTQHRILNIQYQLRAVPISYPAPTSLYPPPVGFETNLESAQPHSPPAASNPHPPMTFEKEHTEGHDPPPYTP